MLNIAEESVKLFDPAGKALEKDVKEIIRKLKRLSKVCIKGTTLQKLENKKWKIRHYKEPRPL